MKQPSPPSPRHARQALRWILREDSGDFGPRDRRRLAAWLAADPRHRAAFEQQRAFWRDVDRAAPEVLAALPELAAEGRVATPVPVSADSLARRSTRTPARRWRRPRLALAAAAVLAVVVLAPQAWLALRSDLRAGVQPRAFALEDGSEVFLDADSAVAVRFDAGGRDLELLRGRAWFRVAHEARPFRVGALGGEIRDIGTAFSVELDGGQVTTAVNEGRVEVAAVAGGGNRQRVQLVQGQRIRYRQGEALLPAPQRIAAGEVAPWRQGEVLFDRVPARRAIERLARYRRAPVWIFGDAPAAEPITATFHTDRADEAIRAVAGQAGLKVRVLPGDLLVLTPRGE